MRVQSCCSCLKLILYSVCSRCFVSSLDATIKVEEDIEAPDDDEFDDEDDDEEEDDEDDDDEDDDE